MLSPQAREPEILWMIFLMPGFAPARRVPFVSAKGTKTISARARPPGGPFATVPNQDGSGTRSAQTVLAEKSIRDGGSAAPNAGDEVTSVFSNDRRPLVRSGSSFFHSVIPDILYRGSRLSEAWDRLGE